MIIAPLAAVAVARAGWRFPFPRIFDRTVMHALLGVMLFAARDLNLVALLSAASDIPRAKYRTRDSRLCRRDDRDCDPVRTAFALGGGARGAIARAGHLIPKYFLSAIAIAIHRGGILPRIPARRHERGLRRPDRADRERRDLRRRASGAIARALLRHRLRARRRIAHTRAQLDQFTDPAIAIPTLIGLFLLGIVLGEAYILTGSVYFSIGLHCGFVLGAKMWPKIISEPRRDARGG